MEALCRYIVALVAAALLCGVLMCLTQSCRNKDLMRMLCGVFMTLVLIQPVMQGKKASWESLLPEIDLRTDEIVREGEQSAEILRQEFIKQRLEAYISSRAEAMGVQITAQISLSEEGIPACVRITGEISPLSRSRLSQMITDELGIPREQQEWNG